MGKHAHTPASAAAGIGHAIRMLEGRWKLVILFHLFGGKTLRFSDLERAIPGISQKMLSQQLRQLEQDGVVTRTAYPESRRGSSIASRTGGSLSAPRSTDS
jgi:DNA-binding HxlR family transcriptional regulator